VKGHDDIIEVLNDVFASAFTAVSLIGAPHRYAQKLHE
jgi:hypothetical protein